MQMSDEVAAAARRCTFGKIEINEYSTALDRSKVPSTPGPGIGLGTLQRVSYRRVESFEMQRAPRGVHLIPPGERMKRVMLLSRRESVDEAGREASKHREEVRQSQLSSFAEQLEAMHSVDRVHGILSNLVTFTGTAIAVLCLAWTVRS